MASNTRSQLEQAYRLIQEERLDEAISTLRPVLASEPNNGDAWWLMANAVSEPQDAYNALQNVLRINPRHSEARDLLNTLTQEFPYLTQPASSDFGDSDASFDDLFNGTPAAAPPAQSSGSNFSSADLDALLGGSKTSTSSYSGSAMTDDFGDVGGLDDLFATSSSRTTEPVDTYGSSSGGTFGGYGAYDDPFAESEPAFVQDDIFVEEAGGKDKKRRGRAEPKPRQPKPRKLAKEAPPVDPFEAERRANKRPSPFRVLVILLALGLLVGAGVAAAFMTGLIGQPPAAPTQVFNPDDDSLFGISTDNVSGAVMAIGARFRKEGFQQGVAILGNKSGNTLQVQFCDFADRSLEKDVNRAIDLIAQGAAPIRASVSDVTLTIVNCSNPSAILYRARAPISVIGTYMDGGMVDKHIYRTSWEVG